MKYALTLLIVALSLGTISCEESDSEEYLLDSDGVVEYVNDLNQPSVWSEIITTKDKHIHIGDDTEILVERPSGSGFSPGGQHDIYPELSIKWYYYASDVDYAANPVIFPAKKIAVYK